jgi:3-phosphoshikimate 1-carboxyvinyltransferase
VEADWSAASYWYELAAIAAHRGCDVDFVLPALTPDSRQGDRVVAQLFEPLGVKTEYTDKGARLHNSEFRIHNSEIDFTHCPDIAQTLAVTYCLLGVPYVFKGVHSLRIKETDRVAALIAELRKLGYVLRAEGDELLVWDGTRCEAESAPTIATYDDHRMAMSFAPAALCFGGLTIEHPEVVTKSYPGFWEEVKKLQIESFLQNY